MAETHSAPVASSSEPDPYFSDLLSPLSGTIVERKVFNGQYVTEGDRLLTIVDTSVLWFRFDVYERQLPWLRKGQKVQVTVAALPGQEFSGVISVIEPTLDEATRTVKVRANITNPVVGDAAQKERLLRLGMYAEGSVLAELPDALTVPRTAVLFPGGRAYAYVEEGAGAYAMRPVKLGRQGDGLCEVLEGLEEGDRVVTTGNVLIDAQAQFTQPRRQEPAQVEGKTQLAHSATQVHAREEMAEPGIASEVPQLAQKPEIGSSATMTRAQEKALGDFLSVAGDISAALASDSLSDLKRAVLRLKGATPPLIAEFGNSHPWHTTIQGIAAASVWSEGEDLAAARAAFLPFSTQVVKLVQLLQADESNSRSLKVYHCPMAPKPGLWFQAKGPLRNPYYGAKMLSCGEEVRCQERPLAMASRDEPPAAQRETPVPPAAPVNTIRTKNTRHPEAKERMLRTFALGVAEQHRMASKPPVAKSPRTGAQGSELESEAREAVAMNRMASAMKSGPAQRNQSNAVARTVSP
jgi:Cu(I)/Ag(I) efflux system membrane fusion protein